MFVQRTTSQPATPGTDAGRSGDRVEVDRGQAALDGNGSRSNVRDMIRAVVLTAEEEKELGWLVVHEGCQASRERLIRGHLRLAAAIAENYLDRGLSLEELTEAANAGLVRATGSIDPSQGGRFSTHASWHIKHAIRQALATVRSPVYFRS